MSKNNLNSNSNSKRASSSTYKSSSQKKNISENIQNYYLIPLLFVLGVIPFLVRLKVYDPELSQYAWFADNHAFTDIFLFYKHWAFVIVSGILALIIINKAHSDKKNIKLYPIFIPLAVYAFFALLSSVFSTNIEFSFKGGFEQFESIFALLGYCIITYYSFLFVKTESDLKKILNYLLIVGVIMSAIGVFQYMGYDLFTSRIGYKLIMPLKYQNGSELTTVFGDKRVYLSLYNPNYVGVYAALVLPIIMIMLFYTKSIKNIIISILAILGLVVCVIGAQSLAGTMGLAGAMLFIMLFMWRYLIKKIYITLSVTVVLIIGLFILNIQTDNLLVDKLRNNIVASKTNFALTQMDTNDDNISLTYNGNKMYVEYKTNEDLSVFLNAFDENGQIIISSFDPNTYTWTITDDRFLGIVLGADQNSGIFYIQESGVQWQFTRQTEDGTYYLINRMGKLDKMITADSAVFTGYEWFATGRGYIWSRTIPLLKDYIILGSGPDTFAMNYPQQDYINFNRYGYGNGIITKPHNMYLQIWAQTGLISLIAFLTFYGMYFVTSVRLYIRGRFNSYYAKAGVAIFVGTVGYMLTGLTNDSTITVAPMFWTLLGVGLAMNYKVKPLIKSEIEEVNATKAAKKALKE